MKKTKIEVVSVENDDKKDEQLDNLMTKLKGNFSTTLPS